MIKLALTHNRQMLLKLAILPVIALLLTAATDVTTELLHRPDTRREALSQIIAWEHEMTLEMPSSSRTEWQAVAQEMPLLFLRASSAATATAYR
jgi:hypothetical protein